MRTHVWRKNLVRLSQRNQRLPFQRRRCFHSTPRPLDNHNHNHNHNDNHQPDAEATKHDDHQQDPVTKPQSGGRRTPRYSRRTRDVAPFTVPDWFLRHNVRLHAPSTHPKAKGEDRCWSLVDRHTGHTVLTLPFTTTAEDKDKDKDSSDFFTSSTAPTPSHEPAQAAASQEPQKPDNEDKQEPQKSDNEHKQEPQKSDNEHKQESPADDDVLKRAVEKLKSDKPSPASPLPAPPTPDPRLLLSLQLQLLLHAAFSITGPQSVRFPKSNIDLQTFDAFAHKELDQFVLQIADLVGADVIRLEANDIAYLAQEYLDPQDYSSGSIPALAHDVFKGIGAANSAPTIQVDLSATEDSSRDETQDHQESEDEFDDFFSKGGSAASSPFGNIDMGHLTKLLKANMPALNKALGQGGRLIPIGIADISKSEAQTPTASSQSPARSHTISAWDELKLSSLFDSLIDSTATKRDNPTQSSQDSFLFPPVSEEANSDLLQLPTHDAFERFLVDFLARRIDSGLQQHDMSWSFNKETKPAKSDQPGQRTILHIHDMDHIRNVSQGEAIIEKLVQLVQRRRKDGQQIVIVGTTASALQSPPPPNKDDEDEPYFRSLNYPVTPRSANTRERLSNMRQITMAHHLSSDAWAPQGQASEPTLAKPGYHKLADINLRNIYAMIRRLGLPMSETLFASNTRSHLNIPGTARLGDQTMSQEEVQRIVLCAESLRSLYTNSPALETFHIAFATMLNNAINSTLVSAAAGLMDSIIPPARPRGASETEPEPTNNEPPKLNMEQLKKNCSKHETRLLSGVVDPASLRTTFSDVHAEPATIESLKTLTSLTLLRPEAFKYGVLAADRLPGLLLYGPPGTGKTLLAKAVAKESKATVLEVSGAQVYEKYVGEGEKMVKAVFSLAKKLSPCVVFIDEADALFGSRGGANNRTTHREIINQFLREWDGMDDHSVFMMVATNRPFDLDDAVLRRLPRRLLVDLPVTKDRESILKIHLKDETLDSAVSLGDLAKNTPLYSGSDLKNLCVAAALAAVRDENDALTAARARGDEDFSLPARRTLEPTHFDRALQEISASVSEDMSTLGAIRKFDEQYGERRARNKKAGYGFGLGMTGSDENGARVRPDEPRR